MVELYIEMEKYGEGTGWRIKIEFHFEAICMLRK